MKAHTVTCAGNWCPEFSVRISFRPDSADTTDHRRELAQEGWTDVEGRDYCPDCSKEIRS